MSFALGEGDMDEEENVEEVELISLPKMVCQKWIKTAPFTGMPRYNSFRQIIQEESGVLSDGEILVQALFWTVDRYMRVYDIPLESVMIGDQLGSVVASKNPDYPVHTLLVSRQGWTTFTSFDPTNQLVVKVPPLESLPLSLYLDTLGFPGILAYYALFYKCCINPGDTIVINAATGPLANILGQMAKIAGCRVIAFCESLDQCKWLQILGFNKVFNSKRTKTSAALHIEAQNGVDFYFDCAGAAFTLDVLSTINPEGTVCVFGQNAAYEKSTVKGHHPDPYHMVVMQNQQVYNDSLTNHTDIFTEAQEQILSWIQEGKLQYKQEVFCGFEKLPHALGVLYEGRLVGKIIVMSSSLEFCSRRCDEEKCQGSSGDGITVQSALY